VLTIIALSAAAFGIYAIGFMFLHSERVYGATHAIHFGNAGLFLGFASLALLPISRHYGLQILSVIGLASGICASVMSGSRGGWLAIPILIAISLIMAIRSLRLNRYAILGIVSLMMLIAVGLWQTNYVQSRIAAVQTDWTELGEFDPLNAVEVRFLMWEQAWMEVRQAPLLGGGYSGYRNRVRTAVESGQLPKYMLAYSTEPHNEYLYQWATRGIIGLLFFLLGLTWMSGYFLKLLLHGDRNQVSIAQIGLSLVTIIAVAGLTISIIDQRDVIRFLGWILAVLMYCVWLLEIENRQE
jgi:O-antigen ligase